MAKKPAKAAVSAETSQKKQELLRRMYALAGDPKKAKEFEKLRLELSAL